MITVIVNDNKILIEEKASVFQLLKQINSTADGIAVAINKAIVPKDIWATKQFNSNDDVLIIKATQGG
ncbi:MAG: sulfur carrier protein [Flavobacteriales bacterium]|jgi:sulfur carrier protein|tara:strand:+ start:124 stop:327 length:204 start_codon:yes stop_codon:yes gene_type:complete